MKHAEFPTAAIPGHGHRNHLAARRFERVVGAADTDMKFTVVADQMRDAIRAHVGDRGSTDSSRRRRAASAACRSTRIGNAQRIVACSANSSASQDVHRSLIDRVPAAERRQQHDRQRRPHQSFFFSCSLERIVDRARMHLKLPDGVGRCIQRSDSDLPLWRETAVGAKVRSLSASLSATRRLEIIRPHPFAPPGTHRRIPALGRHALSQLQRRCRAEIRRSPCRRSANSSAAAIDACRRRRCPSMNPLESWTRARRQRPARHLARPLDGAASRSTAGACSPIRCGARAPRLRASSARSVFSRFPSSCASCRRSMRSSLSHDHYDHLDYTTMRLHAQIVGADHHVARCRRAPRSLSASRRSASSNSTGGNRIACRAPTSRSLPAPSQHFSGRGLKDGNRTLWSSFVIQSHAPSRVLQRRYRPDGRTRAKSARGSGRSTSSCSKWARSTPPGATFTWGRRTRSRRTPC